MFKKGTIKMHLLNIHYNGSVRLNFKKEIKQKQHYRPRYTVLYRQQGKNRPSEGKKKMKRLDMRESRQFR